MRQISIELILDARKSGARLQKECASLKNNHTDWRWGAIVFWYVVSVVATTILAIWFLSAFFAFLEWFCDNFVAIVLTLAISGFVIWQVHSRDWWGPFFAVLFGGFVVFGIVGSLYYSDWFQRVIGRMTALTTRADAYPELPKVADLHSLIGLAVIHRAHGRGEVIGVFEGKLITRFAEGKKWIPVDHLRRVD